MVAEIVQVKNRISCLLMEAGMGYNQQKLHHKGYFQELMTTNPDIDESLRPLLQLCRETLVRLRKTSKELGRETPTSLCTLQKSFAPINRAAHHLNEPLQNHFNHFKILLAINEEFM